MEIRRHLLEVDAYRRSNLLTITERLAQEHRLRAGLDPASAAELAFALSLPSVYEELVVIRGWTLEAATEDIAGAAVAALVDPLTSALTDPPPDWSMALRADAVVS